MEALVDDRGSYRLPKKLTCDETGNSTAKS